MVLCLSSDLDSFAKVLVSFGKCPPIWVNMIMIALRLCALGKFATEVKSPLKASSQCYIMLVCLITGDVSLDHLTKVVSTRILCCRVTVFPFIIIKYCGGDTLRPCLIE